MAVVTTEDKPVGRHLVMTPNPVKVLALKIGLPVYDKIKDFLMTTNDYSMTIGLVAAYGKIIPQNVLDNFGGQMYNIHPSILPKYRGPSPLQQQILDDVVDTGVTIIRMDDKMDHGSIIGVVHDTILPSDTTISLGNRLFALGADAILNSQFSIFNQIPIPQNHNEATYTHKLTKQDGFVNYLEIENCKLKI
ncbi:methionyl-tRNA formyltransferase [Candidatus Amesbacteria bacterium]|nr:methionyl-tRNA formyltransferase [Candidatus Amesbacteria bacterium]